VAGNSEILILKDLMLHPFYFAALEKNKRITGNTAFHVLLAGICWKKALDKRFRGLSLPMNGFLVKNAGNEKKYRLFASLKKRLKWKQNFFAPTSGGLKQEIICRIA